MRKIITMLIMLIVMAVSSIAFAETDISRENLIVEGVATNLENPTDAYAEAVAVAYKDGIGKVNNIRIDGKSTVQTISNNGTLKANIKSVLRNAKIVKYFCDEQGSYHVVVEIPMYGANGLMSVITPQTKKVDIPTLESLKLAASAGTYSAKGDYTGLVIDCKGMEVNTAVAPSVVSVNRKVIYGIENISHDMVVNHGLVDYADDLKDTDRAGKNPLVVKAVSLSEHNTRVAISELDVVKIISENEVSGFLSSGKVVFLK